MQGELFMKVRVQAKAGAAGAPRYRVTYSPDYSDQAWVDASGPEPTPATRPGAFYVERELVDAPQAPAKKPPLPQRLSLSQLRRRLHRGGVLDNARARQLAIEIHAGPPRDALALGSTALGWPVAELQRRYGRRVVRALLRRVQQTFLMLDEAHSLLAGDGVGDFLRAGMARFRRLGGTTLEVGQSVEALKAATAGR
jgi:hypothetical protein